MVFTGSNWVLAGLTSGGEGCARTGFPGIYTRVSVFISFINYIMNFSGVTGGSTTQTSSSSSSTAAKNTATNLEHFLHNSLSYFSIHSNQYFIDNQLTIHIIRRHIYIYI